MRRTGLAVCHSFFISTASDVRLIALSVESFSKKIAVKDSKSIGGKCNLWSSKMVDVSIKVAGYKYLNSHFAGEGSQQQ